MDAAIVQKSISNLSLADDEAVPQLQLPASIALGTMLIAKGRQPGEAANLVQVWSLPLTTFIFRSLGLVHDPVHPDISAILSMHNP